MLSIRLLGAKLANAVMVHLFVPLKFTNRVRSVQSAPDTACVTRFLARFLLPESDASKKVGKGRCAAASAACTILPDSVIVLHRCQHGTVPSLIWRDKIAQELPHALKSRVKVLAFTQRIHSAGTHILGLGRNADLVRGRVCKCCSNAATSIGTSCRFQTCCCVHGGCQLQL